ncbi:MAG: undecaprenyl-diphosphate phosphatase [Alphaproteobacteria bacterium]|nr:undecaprenyl-diphosphate phosphatase [Alphaproteobacteria bacterium]
MLTPDQLIHAVALGTLEAATEFLPVSSTGHLLLAGHFLGFEGPPGKVFEIAIQLGAILAICVLYFQKLWGVVLDLPGQNTAGRQARNFTLAVLAGFLPAAVVGILLHDTITTYLFNPIVVCAMLVVGGLVILYLENVRRAPASVYDIDALDWRLALKIGALQCLAMVPGVSRSGATIMGAMWLGVNRKVATEFSFFLAIPTMVGAVALSLWEQRALLRAEDLALIGVGLVTAFLVALLVVRWLVGFVARRTFTPFAWYRITVGGLGLLALALWG